MNRRLKRPVIGFLISRISDEGFAALMWPGIMDKAKELDVNIVAFPGESIKVPYGYEYQSNIIYEFINKFNMDALILNSGIMSNYVGLESFVKYIQRFSGIPIISIAEKIEGIPSVIVDNTPGIKDAIRHLIDVHKYGKIAFIKGPEGNRDAEERFAAYRDVLSGHGIPLDDRYIAQGNFISFSAYEAVRLFYMERKLKPDAIVAANDDMAFGALQHLREMGIRVPEEVALTGFDNNVETEFIVPSLTTVRQPVYEQASKAVELAVGILNGEKVPESVVLPTELVIRCSCGCLPSPIQAVSRPIAVNFKRAGESAEDAVLRRLKTELDLAFITEEGARLIVTELMQVTQARSPDTLLLLLQTLLVKEDKSVDELFCWQEFFIVLRNIFFTINPVKDEALGRLMEDTFHKAGIIIGELIQREQTILRLRQRQKSIRLLNIIERLSRSLDLDVMVGEIAREMTTTAGIRHLYISLYEREFQLRRGDSAVLPKTMSLRAAYSDGVDLLDDSYPMTYKALDIIPSVFWPQNERFTLVFRPLFFMEDQFGFILFEYGDFGGNLYESLWYKICATMKSSFLFSGLNKAEKKLLDALEDLEKSNEKLNVISQMDELTNLYNRRGFLNLGRQNLNLSNRLKKSGHLFFADLDGLKKINDTHGHNEGDSAIIQTSLILKKSFRAMDIISRLGGDEFAVLTINSPPDFLNVVKSRLLENLKEYNRMSGKAYAISISIGAISFDYPHDFTVEKLLNEADRMLYEQKRAKRHQ